MTKNFKSLRCRPPDVRNSIFFNRSRGFYYFQQGKMRHSFKYDFHLSTASIRGRLLSITILRKVRLVLDCGLYWTAAFIQRNTEIDLANKTKRGRWKKNQKQWKKNRSLPRNSNGVLDIIHGFGMQTTVDHYQNVVVIFLQLQ